MQEYGLDEPAWDFIFRHKAVVYCLDFFLSIAFDKTALLVTEVLVDLPLSFVSLFVHLLEADKFILNSNPFT